MKKPTLESYGISKAELARQIREAKKRSAEEDQFEPRAVSVKHENGQTVVELSTGWTFSFNPRVFSEFKDANEAELADVKIWGQGYTLGWTILDAHIGVGAIILELIGKKFLASELNRRRGQMKSEKKQAASRENGKLGGRPKKNVEEGKISA